MTIKELKDYLQGIINDLENYDDEEEIKVVSNTYFLKDKNNFLATCKGFIDLSNPIKLFACEWCGDTYSKSEIIKEKTFGHLCEQCFSYLLSKGEKLEKEEND